MFHRRILPHHLTCYQKNPCHLSRTVHFDRNYSLHSGRPFLHRFLPGSNRFLHRYDLIRCFHQCRLSGQYHHLLHFLIGYRHPRPLHHCHPRESLLLPQPPQIPPDHRPSAPDHSMPLLPPPARTAPETQAQNRPSASAPCGFLYFFLLLPQQNFLSDL